MDLERTLSVDIPPELFLNHEAAFVVEDSPVDKRREGWGLGDQRNQALEGWVGVVSTRWDLNLNQDLPSLHFVQLEPSAGLCSNFALRQLELGLAHLVIGEAVMVPDMEGDSISEGREWQPEGLIPDGSQGLLNNLGPLLGVLLLRVKPEVDVRVRLPI